MCMFCKFFLPVLQITPHLLEFCMPHGAVLHAHSSGWALGGVNNKHIGKYMLVVVAPIQHGEASAAATLLSPNMLMALSWVWVVKGQVLLTEWQL